MSLEVTVLTLPFDPLIEGFSNERIRDCLQGRELVRVETFAFLHAGRPYWSLTLVHRRLQGFEPDELEVRPAAQDKPARARNAERDAHRGLLAELSEHERALLDRLRGWRRATAQREAIAAYMICSDQVLLALVCGRPRLPCLRWGAAPAGARPAAVRPGGGA